MPSFKFTALTLLTLATCPALAQDFVVTTRGDTLRGKVRITSLANIDNVQVTVQNKKSEISALATLAVSIDREVYHTVLVIDGYRFLKLSREGSVSIYLARQTEGMPYNVPYLVKKSGETLEVPNLFFGKKVGNFLKDCGLIQENIEENKLGRKDLDQIVDEYNQCLESRTQKIFKSTEGLVAITQLKNSLKQTATISADAMDILDDMYQKVKEKKPVPNYMTTTLRGLLEDYPDFQRELDSLMTKLKG